MLSSKKCAFGTFRSIAVSVEVVGVAARNAHTRIMMFISS